MFVQGSGRWTPLPQTGRPVQNLDSNPRRPITWILCHVTFTEAPCDCVKNFFNKIFFRSFVIQVGFMTTCHRIMSPSNFKICRGLSGLVCERPVNPVHFSTSIQTELIITDYHPVHLKTAITLVGLDNNFLLPDLNFLTVHLSRVCLYIRIFNQWIDHTS